MRSLQCSAEVRDGLGWVAGLGVGLGEIGFDALIAGLQAERSFELRNGLCWFAEFDENFAQGGVAFWNLWRETHNISELGPGFVEIAGLHGCVAGTESGVGALERVGLLRAGGLGRQDERKG